MGIPLTGPVASSEEAALQSRAARAQAGDKEAQLELGIAFEEGRGVPIDLDRAEDLYRAAATQTGGVRMMHVPAAGENGRAATIPVSGGPAEPGLPEAAARLAALQAARSPEKSASPTNSEALPADVTTSDLSTPITEVLTTMVRIEQFSDACFPVLEQNGDLEEYSDKAWRCVLTSPLPADCRAHPDAVLRSIRFIRFNANFQLLQRSALEMTERCVPTQSRSVSDIYSTRARANFLDLVMQDAGHATPLQKSLIETYVNSSAAHAPRHPPIEGFADTMCRRLMMGATVEPVSFWLLFCNSENLNFGVRSDRSGLIDRALMEKGVYGGTD